MNPNNGHILALANFPNYDPNVFPESNAELNLDARRNRAITDVYEPGSTIKALVLSALIDQNLVEEDEVIDTENGKLNYKGIRIFDTHKHEKLTVREVLSQSSNIGIVKLSERIDENTFYKYLRDYGFGNYTSIELPGEVAGYLKKPTSITFSNISKAFISFGYEISVTPLQLITAYSALINGGVLYQPAIVKSIKSANGEIIKEFDKKRIRRVIKEKTSSKLKEFLLDVVEKGTGTAARLDNVFVGGKTGTSQRYIDDAYSKEEYNASFIGFFPYDQPSIIGFILITSPKKSKYGGTVAAPIFKNIAERLIESDLNLVPDEKKIFREGKIIDQFFASINDENPEDFMISSNYSEINKSKNRKDTITLSSGKTMPNLVDLSIRDAVKILTELGMNFDIEGNGKVIHQSIKVGSKINRNMICVIKGNSGNSLKNLRIN